MGVVAAGDLARASACGVIESHPINASEVWYRSRASMESLPRRCMLHDISCLSLHGARHSEKGRPVEIKF
jgi:hypothetical protein